MKKYNLVAVLVIIILVGVWKSFSFIDDGFVENAFAEQTPPVQSGTENGPDVAEPNQTDPNAQSGDNSEFIQTQQPQTDPNQAGQAQALPEESEPLEVVNLNNVEMRDILQKISQWTGKPIIPASDEIMQLRITIFAPDRLPRNKALKLVYDALRSKGVIAEQSEDKIFLKPLAQAKLGSVPTLGPDDPLARLTDRTEVVEKFFRLASYSPTRMAQIVAPLTADYGHVTAIEATRTIVVIDTVENLLRIERIIKELDVPASEQLVEEIFEVENGDPSEIVQVVEMILEISRSSSGRSSSDRGRSGQQASPPQQPPSSPDRSQSMSRQPAGGDTKPAMSVVIESVRITPKLIPIPKQNWIIVRASSEDMKVIAEWIKRLDRKESVKPEQTVVQVNNADVTAVANIVRSTISNMPGTDLRANVVIEPLVQTKQIVIFGSEENRKMVEKMIAEIDLPVTDLFVEKTFKLKHADPDQMKSNIEGLYSNFTGSSSSGGFNPFGGGFGRSSSSASVIREEDKIIKVISYPTLKQITVIASERNMEKITRQIEQEWDIPIDIHKDQYRILTLENSDPVKMTDLLTTLFSAESSSSSSSRGGRDSFMMSFFGGSSSTANKEKIVGSLYGLLTFEPVPDTRKIILISKIPEAYDVIERLVKELDSQEKAEVPRVFTLKYADTEDLCDQLNAILNEPGTTATIQRSTRGLGTYTADEGSSSAGQTNEASGTITPWWDRSRSTTNESMPASNLIGKIRFIPVHRSKSILVLAPPEYYEDIAKMIEQLDKPGMQVMVKVVILEVDHSDMTSLGVQLASDSTTFGTLGEDALTTLTKLTNNETRGSTAITTTANVNVLVDLLVKKTNARVLNQPTLWTKDNEEAVFIKGQKVSFIESDQTDNTNPSAVNRTFVQKDVGVTLRVRPNITPEKAVDMSINLIISQLQPELINTQNVVSNLDTTTHMIVSNGQTILLGGILFQNDSIIKRKIPLLGDIPLVGALFSHQETEQKNNELLAFVTPYVIDENNLQSIQAEGNAAERIEEPIRKMEKILESFDEIFNTNEDITPGSEQSPEKQKNGK